MGKEEHFDSIKEEFYPETKPEVSGRYRGKFLGPGGEIYIDFGEGLTPEERRKQREEIKELQANLGKTEERKEETGEKPEIVTERELLEIEKAMAEVMEYIENPEKRSERWEKLFEHAQTMMSSYVDMTPKGPVSVDGSKETMGVYLERHILDDFPESAAAILKAAKDKFGNNTHIIIAPTAEKSDVAVSEKVMEILQGCDNILFAINLSKQRIVRDLWNLALRVPENVKHRLREKEWEEEDIIHRASLITWGVPLQSGDLASRYLRRFKKVRPRIGMLAGFKDADKLLTPGFEADPKEINQRLEIMEKYFQSAQQVYYYSTDKSTNLILDVENCPTIKHGNISRDLPFNALPVAAHFMCNPNSVEGKFQVNLHVGKIKYSPKNFPDLKEHPIKIEFKQGRIINIQGLDQEGEKVAGPLRELYEELAQKEKEAGGDPNQVYQVVEFGWQLNPELTQLFESQTKSNQIRGGDFRVCETNPHLGTAGSYGTPDSRGNLKHLKGTTVHIDLMADYFTEGMTMEVEYKDGSKQAVMKNGKWIIFEK